MGLLPPWWRPAGAAAMASCRAVAEPSSDEFSPSDATTWCATTGASRHSRWNSAIAFARRRSFASLDRTASSAVGADVCGRRVGVAAAPSPVEECLGGEAAALAAVAVSCSKFELTNESTIGDRRALLSRPSMARRSLSRRRRAATAACCAGAAAEEGEGL